MKAQRPVLQYMIFVIASKTLSSLRCPIKLLTIALLVLAKAHTKTPTSPNTLRITLLIDLAMVPFSSIMKKNTSQVATLMMYCNTNGTETVNISLLVF